MILHVDMDAFYAAVEVRDDPALAGRPVIVGGRPGSRGVVAAASYAARAFGVHSAMPSDVAFRLCPDAIFLRPRMDRYGAVSQALHAIFQRYTPLVEPLALDEAFLDVTGAGRLLGAAPDIARRLKTEIRAELGLVASVGVASTKFVAKIASDLEKPDALVVVEPGAAQAFLDPLPVARLWGVGRVADARLAALGIRTIGEFRRTAPVRLQALFGAATEHLLALASGVDPRPVVPDREARSISHETTFERDIADARLLQRWLLDLADQVARRLRRHRRRAGAVFVKVRFADFRTVTRRRTLAEPTDTSAVLRPVAGALLDRALAAPGAKPVRLLGVGVSALEAAAGEASQVDLFGAGTGQRARALDRTLDAIAERFGPAAVRRGPAPGDLP